MAYTFKHGDRPLDGVTIQRAVGRGGFGEVYFALMDSGKQLAVKYLRDNPEVELRGIAHVMNLKSPHLITIYDVRRNAAGEPFVLMEYVGGPSLRDLLIAEPKGLGPQKAAFFLTGIGKGLDYLHERGIVHRDLKPGNIFYDDGYVKIGDYGLSKHIAVSQHSGQTVSVGTVHYMAPEIGSGSYSKAIDIYALGVILYEMLTGRLPFTGSSMAEILMRHLRDPVDTRDVPEPFASVIRRALQKDPKDRYQDVDQMIEAVTGVSEISDSVASFDASVLAHAKRAADAVDEVEQTRTATPWRPRPVDLDVRGAAAGAAAVGGVAELPPIPPIPDVLGSAGPSGSAGPPPAPVGAAQRPAAARRGRHLAALPSDLPETEAARARPEAAPRSRWAQFVAGMIVLFGAAGGLGAVYDRGEVFGASLLLMAGAAVGAFIGRGIVVGRGATEYTFVDRIVMAGCGLACMFPGFTLALEELPGRNFGSTMLVLAASLLVFDWNDRIRIGARQQVEGGKVFAHALFGLIAGAILGTRNYLGAAIGMCAALPVIVQLLAAAFAKAPRPPRHEQHGRWKDRVERVVDRTGTFLERIGDRIDRIGERLERRVGGHAHEPLITPPPPPPAEARFFPGAKIPPSPPGGAAPAPARLDAVAREESLPALPLMTRVANAGLAFVSWLLLVLGLSGAILFPAQAKIPLGHGEIGLRSGHFSISLGDEYYDVHVPRPAVFAPLVVGGLLLVIARRHGGVLHVGRALLGSGLLTAAAALAMSGHATVLESLFEGGSSDDLRRLVGVVGMCIAALVALSWRPRQPNTIVI